MPKIITTPSFEKRLQKFKKQHPKLRSKYVATIKLVALDPWHPTLRLHKLKGDLSHLYSVSINYKYRIILTFIIKEDQIILIDIGSHDQVY